MSGPVMTPPQQPGSRNFVHPIKARTEKTPLLFCSSCSGHPSVPFIPNSSWKGLLQLSCKLLTQESPYRGCLVMFYQHGFVCTYTHNNSGNTEQRRELKTVKLALSTIFFLKCNYEERAQNCTSQVSLWKQNEAFGTPKELKMLPR